MSTYIDYSDKIIEHVKGGKVSVEDGMELLIKGKSLFKTTFTGAMLANGVEKQAYSDDYAKAIDIGGALTIGRSTEIDKLKAYQQAEAERLWDGWYADGGIIHHDSEPAFLKKGVLWIRDKTYSPITLNDFIGDCQRAGIQLTPNPNCPTWNEIGVNEYLQS